MRPCPQWAGSSQDSKRSGAKVIANDIKNEEELKDVVEELNPMGVEWALGISPMDYLDRVDLIVLSPGIPIDAPLYEVHRKWV